MFWIPGASPEVVAIQSASAQIATRPTSSLPPSDAVVSADGWHHCTIADVHQIVADARTTDIRLAAILPLDDWFPARVAAAMALWRTLQGRRAIEPFPPTAQRRARLILGLRALDGRADGASYRELARGLFGASRVPDGASWKTHDLRSRTMRLAADAAALRDGGYRQLLAPKSTAPP